MSSADFFFFTQHAKRYLLTKHTIFTLSFWTDRPDQISDQCLHCLLLGSNFKTPDSKTIKIQTSIKLLKTNMFTHSVGRRCTRVVQ